MINAEFNQYAYSYHQFLLIFYTGFFCIPFILQLDIDNSWVVILCNCSCLVVSITLTLILYLDWYYGRYSSIKEIMSVATSINVGQYISYFGYFIWRIRNYDISVLPDDPEHIYMESESLIAIIHVFIIFGMIIKLMDIIKFTNTF